MQKFKEIKSRIFGHLAREARVGKIFNFTETTN